MSLNHLGSAIIHRVSDDANYHDGDRESKQVVSVPARTRTVVYDFTRGLNRRAVLRSGMAKHCGTSVPLLHFVTVRRPSQNAPLAHLFNRH
jgi:hypothetical protein